MKVSDLRRALADLDADAAVLLTHEESFLDLEVRGYSNPATGADVADLDHIVLAITHP